MSQQWQPAHQQDEGRMSRHQQVMTPEETAERDAIARSLDTLITLLKGFRRRGPLRRAAPLALTAERVKAKARAQRKGRAA